MVLACGHSFCGDCAAVVRSCPLCRHRLPQNYQRRTNYSLLSLIEKLERQPPQEAVQLPAPPREQTVEQQLGNTANQKASFLSGKSMTVNVRKTGLRVDIK